MVIATQGRDLVFGPNDLTKCVRRAQEIADETGELTYIWTRKAWGASGSEPVRTVAPSAAKRQDGAPFRLRG